MQPNKLRNQDESIILDFLKATGNLEKHLQEKHALTPPQIETLSRTIMSLQKQFASWMQHHAEARHDHTEKEI
jgi:hypothetical protein